MKPGIHGLELAAGHHPNDLARYRELIGMVGSQPPANFFNAQGTGLNRSLLSLLNVRFIIWPVFRQGGLPSLEPVMATSIGGDRIYEAVYEIPTLPRARLVGEAVVLEDEEAVPYILSPDFRPAQEVVLPEAPATELSGSPVQGSVEWLERSVNRQRLRVRSEGAALLVLADNWYPAWKARVGGEEAPVLRANHTLRAVPIPGGESDVEIYYDRGSLAGPIFLSLASLAVVMGSLILGPRKRSLESKAGDPAP